MVVDEFGREHFIAEAPAGRLGILLVENERGFVIVQGFTEILAADQVASSETDKQRLSVMREIVHAGDRLVAIDGDEVTHCSLSEVTTRLGKLSAKKRQLKFARYHQAQRSVKNYDPEKLVLVRAPSGPLGLILSDVFHYGAVIEGIQQLPDGSKSHISRYQNLHRGCQIVGINGMDVSGLSREEVTNVLAGKREQDKEILFYRMTPTTCARFSKLVLSSEDTGVSFTGTETFRCVVFSVNTTAENEVVGGDVLVGVNDTDVTTMSRVAAMELLNQTPYPRTLTFYHQEAVILPECHVMQIDAGPSGLNLDSSEPGHARITGFTTPEDADRPTCKPLKDFISGSYIIGINGLEVHRHALDSISKLLSKLRHATKHIVVGNASLMRHLEQTRSLTAAFTAPPGPLGIKFDGDRDDIARVSGFNPMVDGTPGVIEESRRIPVGSTLQSINKMSVACLTLAQTVTLLQKLASSPKELVFSTHIEDGTSNPRTVSIRVPPGPLGIDLKTVEGRVVVDHVNENPARGPTYIFNHGGVVSGSEIFAIDGFDTSSLHIADLIQLMRLFASHEKIISFGTTTEAYGSMLSSTRKPALKQVVISRSPMGIEFDSSLENAACVTKSDLADGIPCGSRLIAIDSVNVQTLSLQDIIGILKSLAGIEKTLLFDTDYHQNAPAPSITSPPRSPILKQILKGSSSSDAASTSPTHHASASSSAVEALPTKSTVRFADENLSPEAPPSRMKASQARPPQLEMPPLSDLPTQTVEVTKPQVELSDQKLEPALNTSQTQFMINMTSWSGTRSSSRLVVDKTSRRLHILPLNPSSPSSAKTTDIAFNEISALDTRKASPPPSPSKRGLLRSLSSKKDMAERYTVIISASKTSKSGDKTKTKVYEFDMLSSDQRDDLEAILLQ
ncbi:hypothetical protein PHYPSEUDO_014051 [Phytophthora pseudosyringae]|uniref:PDZ domain-containing protein n=1 Tax=Phytophthora pseudosyringae TaxID=221518 RepID=A0A8T1W6X6_9STRA|nr:hypothetical protein PHYPSEUDO_014051 [Phytophthora pseudosyringae]